MWVPECTGGLYLYRLLASPSSPKRLKHVVTASLLGFVLLHEVLPMSAPHAIVRSLPTVRVCKRLRVSLGDTFLLSMPMLSIERMHRSVALCVRLLESLRPVG